jgi:transaldolase
MNTTAKLQALGQSLWLDNITREMLDSGQLQRYFDEFSITGLTSNPSIFDQAIKSGAYDNEIRHKAAEAADQSETEPPLDHDSATNVLIRRCRAMRRLDAGAKEAAQTPRRRVRDGD